ncbi:GH39 family glycosyl hydrolase [Cohnella yongneupensis]|uniref:Glycosyl hydrolases family 39 N-terminal catalytic domain-containing protein n=1 Tax=Cohnella yongneupensis TaxID=425006 RepID=A0ABW0R2K7_9BACL
MGSRKRARGMAGALLTAAMGLALLFPASLSFAGTATTITVDTASNAGTVNPFVWGSGAPDKYTWWAGNAALKTRISDAKIKLVRVNPIQNMLYNGRDPYPSANNFALTDMDAILNTIFDAGAQPLFVIAGFPAGVPNTRDGTGLITSANWTEYANFMKGVVKRYNTDHVLGASRTIRYWELWNEPTIEGDGKFASQADYKTFAQTVGNAMKTQDSTIKLVGPADAWSDLSSTGYVSYAAKQLESQVDILSWHDYGPDPTQSDATRLAWTKPHYQDNIATVKSGGTGNIFKGPSGKLYGAAITEYNMSHQDGGSAYNAKYHNIFNAVYTASSVVNAMKGNADIFTSYNLAETGTNLLGLLDNTSYSPYKPYYAIHLFGNHFGDRKLTGAGGATNLEFVASKDTATGKTFVIAVNKDASVTYDATVQLQNIASATGTVNVWKLDASTNPTSSTSLAYSGSQFVYSIAPMTVVAFEVTPGSGGGTTLFSNGFESTDAAPTWLDTLDGSQNVTGYTAGTNPECSPRLEAPHAGAATLMFSGTDNSATASYAKCKVFDVNIPITSTTKLGYWLYPQVDNARYVAIDLVMTDGSTLRDSGAVDYNGYSMHPNAGHGGAIPLNAWTNIKSNIGTVLAGKTIDRIIVNYDRPSNTGQYRGYIDDIVLTNGTL